MEEQQFDRIKPINLEDEMRKSYIDYAMSVIASRALPDVRDGLKPVQRRILYSMSELNLTPEKAYRKSARIVGDTMGKYHPHGDSSIYDAMVRMAQNFSMRYELVDGHGNFGSVDGDSAAAMRYTEAKMSKMAMEMLHDIGKETVDFRPNFDESLEEPIVLPAKYPNLLCNGVTGIAVGMATNIPPHNLQEVIDGVVKIIDNRVLGEETPIEELLQLVKGPDFPTGATIYGTKGIDEAYRTGKGRIKVRANVEIEPMHSGKQRLIVTEIPYMVNKARLIEKIADLVKDKKIEGITDLRDESDRKGMRIVIELKRDVNAQVILNQLYKNTQLQDTFSVNMLALVNNEPKILNLKDVLEHYLNHQVEVVTRRTQYDLNKAEAKAHLLEGLLKALDHIDEIISIIRGSENTAQAKERLMERFEFSERQAQAIVDMRLRALTGLERMKLQTEYAELQEKIKELKAILETPSILLNLIKEEILVIRNKFGDERKTAITYDAGEINIEDLIKRENNVITMTKLGYIKRTTVSTYKSQNRGGKGIKGIETRDGDYVDDLFITSTHHYILFFTDRGKVYRLKTYEIPEASRTSRGTAIVNLLQLDPGEKVSAVIPVKEYEEGLYLLMATRNGLIKKTKLVDYTNIRAGGLIAISLRDDDQLIEVKLTNGEQEILMASKYGQCIRFKETDVRATGRASMGVKGMNLNAEDEVIGMQLISQGQYILAVTENGMGKRTKMEEFTVQHRGGKGIKYYRITAKTGSVVGFKAVEDEQDIMLITSQGIIIRLRVSEISCIGRITSGVKLMDLKNNIKVVSVAKVREDIQEDAEELEEE